jgi:hypothetical protein
MPSQSWLEFMIWRIENYVVQASAHGEYPVSIVCCFISMIAFVRKLS